MAQEHSAPPMKTPWTKIFTAFRVALCMKKIALAAAGIFCAFLGWWLISASFSLVRGSEPPKWFEPPKETSDRKAQWDSFKASRESWNLFHELAGSYDELRPIKVDAGDVARNPDEYAVLHGWYESLHRLSVSVTVEETNLKVQAAGYNSPILALDDAAKPALKNLVGRPLTLFSVSVPGVEVKVGEKTYRTVVLDGVTVLAENTEKLRDYLKDAKTLAHIEAEAFKNSQLDALALFKLHLVNPRPKVAGLLRVCPWSENRGGNPYLIVADAIKTRGESIAGKGQILSWFIKDEAPVLLEPLVKFLLPIAYFFDHRASAWDRLYLILIILWTLAVWGFFGGAICRIAAVQFARNERITLREAVLFTKERYVSYVAAPAFPMVLVAIVTVLLIVFGWLIWIPWLGELLAGLLWPIVIVLGFVMAIVLVGLIGWPLMTATVSTEGTDSFDALSRSYSYIYQAPWQFIWYNFLAVVYGAVVVFFIGFMASMLVFMGKWGVSSAAGPAKADPKSDREPSYLFYYAPTSFGWRDLMISSNARYVEEKAVVTYDGRLVRRLEFTDEYKAEISRMNKFGAILVAIWIYPLFLLVVGFGYSFFWSATTIIYFLLRHHVDDTDLDEVHMEDEDLDDVFMKAPPASAAPPAPKPGTVSLNVVEPPPTSSTAYTTADHPPAAAPAPPAQPPPAQPPPAQPPPAQPSTPPPDNPPGS
jgi:hypothetical protein